MKIDTITKAICNLSPNAQFTFERDDLATLQWHSKTSQPTVEEIETEIARIEAEELTQEATKAAAKAALLERLGITAEEAALLLG